MNVKYCTAFPASATRQVKYCITNAFKPNLSDFLRFVYDRTIQNSFTPSLDHTTAYLPEWTVLLAQFVHPHYGDPDDRGEGHQPAQDVCPHWIPVLLTVVGRGVVDPGKQQDELSGTGNRELLYSNAILIPGTFFKGNLS